MQRFDEILTALPTLYVHSNIQRIATKGSRGICRHDGLLDSCRFSVLIFCFLRSLTDWSTKHFNVSWTMSWAISSKELAAGFVLPPKMYDLTSSRTVAAAVLAIHLRSLLLFGVLSVFHVSCRISCAMSLKLSLPMFIIWSRNVASSLFFFF